MSATRSDTHTATRKATHLPLMKCQLHPVVGAATLLCHLYTNWLVPVAREFVFSTDLDTHTHTAHVLETTDANPLFQTCHKLMRDLRSQRQSAGQPPQSNKGCSRTVRPCARTL